MLGRAQKPLTVPDREVRDESLMINEVGDEYKDERRESGDEVDDESRSRPRHVLAGNSSERTSQHE